jgi:hypothetical protein
LRKKFFCKRTQIGGPWFLAHVSWLQHLVEIGHPEEFGFVLKNEAKLLVLFGWHDLCEALGFGGFAVGLRSWRPWRSRISASSLWISGCCGRRRAASRKWAVALARSPRLARAMAMLLWASNADGSSAEGLGVGGDGLVPMGLFEEQVAEVDLDAGSLGARRAAAVYWAEGFVVAAVLGEEIGEVVVGAGVGGVEAKGLFVLGDGLVAAAHVGEELGEDDVGGWVVGVSGEGGLAVFEFGAEMVLGDQAERFAGRGVIGGAAQTFPGTWAMASSTWPIGEQRGGVIVADDRLVRVETQGDEEMGDGRGGSCLPRRGRGRGWFERGRCGGAWPRHRPRWIRGAVLGVSLEGRPRRAREPAPTRWRFAARDAGAVGPAESPPESGGRSARRPSVTAMTARRGRYIRRSAAGSVGRGRKLELGASNRKNHAPQNPHQRRWRIAHRLATNSDKRSARGNRLEKGIVCGQSE